MISAKRLCLVGAAFGATLGLASPALAAVARVRAPTQITDVQLYSFRRSSPVRSASSSRSLAAEVLARCSSASTEGSNRRARRRAAAVRER